MMQIHFIQNEGFLPNSETPYPSRLDLTSLEYLISYNDLQGGQEPTHHVKVAQNLGRLSEVQKEPHVSAPTGHSEESES